MNCSIEKMLAEPVAFLADTPQNGDGIAISSRIRLARNLQGYPFPVNASAAIKAETAAVVREAAVKSRVFPAKSSNFIFPEQLGEDEKNILLERRLASSEFINNPAGTLLITSEDESSSIMVNEEDTLRIQCIAPGFQLDELWKKINNIDSRLGRKLHYAAMPEFGFLTSCPSNVGTGMRASVMLHLPGLAATRELAPTFNGLEKLHLTVRGIRGEGSKNTGNLVQISNTYTLGISEEEAISQLNDAVSRIIEGEKSARRRLLDSNRTTLFDKVGRAYGLIKYSYTLSLDEAWYAISCLRLGCDLGMFNSIDIATVNRLQLAIQPGHLGCRIENGSTFDSCDEKRAFVCRKILKKSISGD